MHLITLMHNQRFLVRLCLDCPSLVLYDGYVKLIDEIQLIELIHSLFLSSTPQELKFTKFSFLSAIYGRFTPAIQ